MTLIELAERCEAAEGPDRKFDVLIEWPEVFEPLRITGAVGNQLSVHWNDDKFCRSGRVREYTASLDAAMTLVPEGQRFMLNYANRPSEAGYAWIAGVEMLDHATGSTPALALCAAALRAIAATNGQAPDMSNYVSPRTKRDVRYRPTPKHSPTTKRG